MSEGTEQVSDQDCSAIDQTAEIVSAYVSQNTISATELPSLIKTVHESLTNLSEAEPEASQQEPAVSVRASVKPDAIACIECGKRFRSLKRHLRTNHDLTPDQYRAKWNLRPDYPMVAPEFAAARSDLAKKLGLGRKAA